jgi:hypothetical protein
LCGLNNQNKKFKKAKMKRFIYLLIGAALLAACTSAPKTPHYTITGKIKGADSITFVLQKR